MQEIIYRQVDAAQPLNGRAFVLRIALILLKLALAQIVCNLLITLTGVGLLNLLFYAYAVALLTGFMRDTVAGYAYTLEDGLLLLERKLGDSTTTLVRIPLERVVSMREVRMAEHLRTTYRQVTHIDPASGPSRRVRAAFVLCLLSARLARALAGRRAQAVVGHVLVYDEGGRLRACTFRPDAKMQAALADALGERYGFDERMTRARVATLHARALERAFPALYPFVDPLVKPEDVRWAQEEMARRKEEKRSRRQPGKQPARQDGATGADNAQAARRRRKQG